MKLKTKLELSITKDKRSQFQFLQNKKQMRTSWETTNKIRLKYRTKEFFNSTQL